MLLFFRGRDISDITHIGDWSQVITVQYGTVMYTTLYISPPSNLSGLSCQTQDPATNWNALSLCDGCFPIPPPCPAGSAVPIPSQYHIKRLTPAPAPLLLLTIALLFDKENFLQIPLKIGKQQLSRHRQAMGEERERMSEVGPKTGIRPQTSHYQLRAEADNGWTDVIHEVWRPGAWRELE